MLTLKKQPTIDRVRVVDDLYQNRHSLRFTTLLLWLTKNQYPIESTIKPGALLAVNDDNPYTVTFLAYVPEDNYVLCHNVNNKILLIKRNYFGQLPEETAFKNIDTGDIEKVDLTDLKLGDTIALKYNNIIFAAKFSSAEDGKISFEFYSDHPIEWGQESYIGRIKLSQ